MTRVRSGVGVIEEVAVVGVDSKGLFFCREGGGVSEGFI